MALSFSRLSSSISSSTSSLYATFQATPSPRQPFPSSRSAPIPSGAEVSSSARSTRYPRMNVDYISCEHSSVVYLLLFPPFFGIRVMDVSGCHASFRYTLRPAVRPDVPSAITNEASTSGHLLQSLRPYPNTSNPSIIISSFLRIHGLPYLPNSLFITSRRPFHKPRKIAPGGPALPIISVVL